MTGMVDKAREAYERWGETALEQEPAACTDYINALQAENASLRQTIHECATALGNGAHISPSCSVEFMAELPKEISSVCSGLRERNELLEAENTATMSEIAALRDDLDRLREQVEKAREALEPFAKYAVSDGFGLDSRGNPLPDGESPGWVYVTNGDFRRASRTMEDILREQAKRPVLRPARALKDKEERG